MGLELTLWSGCGVALRRLTIEDAGGEQGGVPIAQSTRPLVQGGGRSLQGCHDVGTVNVPQGGVQTLHWAGRKHNDRSGR